MGDVHTKVFAVLLAFALASLGDAANEITTAGITEAGANALCTLAAGLEGTAAKAGAEARKALVRARTIAQAAWRSQQAASAAAQEMNASARSAQTVLEEMQLGQRAERAMQKAEELAALASETTARCGFLAGQIKQWIETMAAMATQKDNSGQFCLGGQASGNGQAVLASSNNGQTRTYAANDAVAPPTACEKLFDTAEDAKWGDKEIADWPALDNSVTVASSGTLSSADAKATVCPITGVVAGSGIGGNYRHGVTWAGLWSITAISTANSIATKQETAQLDKIKALVGKLKDLAAESSDRETNNTGEKSWENTCNWDGHGLCSAGREHDKLAATVRNRVREAHRRQEEEERAEGPETERSEQVARGNEAHETAPRKRGHDAASQQVRAERKENGAPSVPATRTALGLFCAAALSTK
ncbi:putative Trypanosome variant surface glycoprotein (A type) [Trypanosoma vivax]|nr:putative Trypanosome variant surface glycoprotein (A type) [Trypanosoma vivax]